MNIKYKYSIVERETKTIGKVYDLSFYYTDTRTGNRVQHHKRGFKTKRDAREYYTEFVTKLLIAKPTDITPNSVLMYEKARATYLMAVKDTVKDSTLYDFNKVGRNYLDIYWHKKDLMKTTKQDLNDFKLWLSMSKKSNGVYISPSTQQKVFRQFMAFYHWCIDYYNVPNVSVPAPKRSKKQANIAVWSQEEFEKFIAVVDDDRFKTTFTILFYCGLRCGELQALLSTDYDGKRLFVHSTYTRKTTDGSTFKITETKNYKSRYVPIPTPAQATIEDWAKKNKDSDYLVGKNSLPLHDTTIQNAFTRYIKKAGLSKIRIHDLRHSYVSMLISHGASFTIVAKLIGDNPEQVVKTYAHYFNKDIDDIISSISW